MMNHYFVTGATGNIGSALIPLLLQHEGNIQLLIRATDEEHLQQRFEELCVFWEINPEIARERIIPCRGDMTEPRFGLNAVEYDVLSARCSHIIHCGGVVRMNLPIEKARKSAVGAAQEVIALAEKALRSGTLKKVDFVSTVGVIGCLSQPLTEQLVTDKRGFHNSYEQAKAEAEELLHGYMAENKLPITIHRPSMVVGDSQTGKAISYQVFYHICEFVSGKRTFGILPRLDNVRLDIIPVDYVASVLNWSAHTESTIGRFVHECSGTTTALPINDLEKYLAQYPYFSTKRSLMPGKTVHIPLSLFNQTLKIVALLLPEKERKALKALPHFLNYLGDQQLFDDQLTTNLLPHDITKPRPASYLEPVLTRYIHG